MSAMYFNFVWIFAILTMSFGSSQGIPSVEEYFADQISGDVSKVTWAHAVNSLELLQNALKDDKVMMLEADILIGKKTGDPKKEIAIMAHPPNKTSDLSFTDFLNEVVNAVGNKKVKKGIKLDFKDVKAVKPVLKSLKSISVDFPVWLNADILLGPIHATKTPVNATTFLSKFKSNFPQATLSVGWVTRYGWDDAKKVNRSKPKIEGDGYTVEQAKEMLSLLKDNQIDISSTPVTFPLRAGLAATSLDCINYLLQAGKTSITLWSAVDDPIDMPQLRTVIESISKAKCYIDLPFPLGTGPKDSSRPANCDIHPDAEEVHDHQNEEREVDGDKVPAHDHDSNSASHLSTASSAFVALLFLGFAVLI